MPKNPAFLEIYRCLSLCYGRRNWWPIVRDGVSLYLPEFLARPRTPEEIFEIAVGAILTQNTAWKNVEKALAALEKSELLSARAILAASDADLAEAVRPAGYYNQKTKKLKLFARRITDELKGNIFALSQKGPEKSREWLLSHWGIGPETADSILLYGFSFPFFVVDAYTRRSFSRIGLLPNNAAYTSIQRTFHENLEFDPTLWREYHALIVELGKDTCRSSPFCNRCCLATRCKSAEQGTASAP
jgi:endonuclease-3 related protein